MFIVILEYQRPLEDVDAHLAEHIEFLEFYYREGTFLASGRRVPRTGGFILARAPSRQDLKVKLSYDPFNTHKIAKYSIIEVAPSMTAHGLETLMGA